MSHNEFNHIISSLGALSPLQMRQLRRELDDKLASIAQKPVETGTGSLGAMRDAADELDTIVEQAMKNREERPWRLSSSE